jgi:hypothetical protein
MRLELLGRFVHGPHTARDLRASQVRPLKAVQIRGAGLGLFLHGSGLMGYSTVFYQRAGLADSQSFTMSLAQYAIGVITNKITARTAKPPT